ncbi:MAG TPA: ATP-binding protein [Candidatus Limnocylindria bacterium]|nr:ATP-binding protein [Candidatus Limnocylindria bacterium]
MNPPPQGWLKRRIPHALLRSQAWALGLALFICFAIAFSHFQQRRVLREMIESLIQIREDRLDLANGFLHAAITVDTNSPISRSQGLAMMIHSASSLEKSAQTGDFGHGAREMAEYLVEYRKEVELLHSRLTELFSKGSATATSDTEVRRAYYKLERLAAKIDETYESHLMDLADRLNAAFMVALAIAGLLLVGICGLVVYSDRKYKASIVARQENESRLRALIDNCPDWVWLKDVDSRYITVNDAFSKELNLPIASFAGRLDTELLLPVDSAHAHLASDKAALKAGEARRFLRKIPSRKGLSRWFETIKAPVKDAQGKQLGTVGISRDVTERIEAENMAVGQKRVLEMIANGEPLKATLEGLLRSIEAQHKDMLCSILLLDPDGLHLRHSASPSLPGSYTAAIDGARIGPVAGSCGTAAYRKETVQVADIAADPLWEGYKDLALSHGLKACWSTPILDANRRVLATFACYFREPQLPDPRHIKAIESAVSTAAICIRRHQSEAALRESEDRLRQAQKMEAVGHLSGGIAHDFNNILTIIQGNASLLLSGQSSQRDVAEAVPQIIEAANRATSLTRQLLAFSRKQVIQPTEVDLNDVIGNTAKMLRRILGDPITVRTELVSPLPLIHADTGMVEQVLMNLAVNSRDAMPTGGELSIASEVGTIDDPRKIGNPEARPGKFVVLVVSDTGCGIPSDVLPHIFEPFFTTKEIGKGTGLGLSSAYGIINQHGGWIEVTSEQGKGTTFKIYFTAREGSLPPPSAPDPEQSPATGTETLLIVEDDPAVRNLVCGLLKKLGYTTLEATSGVAALDVWRDRQQEIDLLLTDVMMPDGLSGWDLAERLRRDRPGLRVIYTSGYSDDLVNRGATLIEGLNFLHKPYPLTKLSSTVRKCLDSSPG